MNSDCQFFPFTFSNQLKILFVIISGLVIGLAHPALCKELCPLVACCGLVPFFLLCKITPSPRKRFFLGMLFFVAIQGVQLSWLLSAKYHGLVIYVVYVVLVVLLGVQGGIYALFIPQLRSVTSAFFLGGLWAIFEWTRLFFMSGYTWNPIGMTLTAYEAPLQLASLFGIYGLSFVVMTTNALACLCLEDRQKRGVWVCLIACVILPYLFGFLRVAEVGGKLHNMH